MSIMFVLVRKNLFNFEEYIMKFEQFELEMKTAYKKHFPFSPIGFSTGCLGKGSICIQTMLIDTVNVTKHNDPVYQSFWLHSSVSGDEMMDKVIFEKSVGSLSIIPPEDSYLAMGTVKLPFRKKTGSPESVIAYFDKYLKRVKETIINNSNNIYNRSQYDDKFFK